MRRLTIDGWSDMFGWKPETKIWNDGEVIAEAPMTGRLEFSVPADVQSIEVSVGSSTSGLINIPDAGAVTIELDEVDRSIYQRTNKGLGLASLFRWPFEGLSYVGGGDNILGLIFIWIFVLIVMPFLGLLTAIGFVIFRLLTGRHWRTGLVKNWKNETLTARVVAEASL